eukprot:TRINITY_DN24931_c0_g1_i1.p1 TRINITY_DN24931_c0_g1~~TRINITY_DN24931_c0_g1_i1.p1  ORF type:complete len:141 (+),score=20.99 TRINITY_DN24931_c0_g1_i1:49-423(+)
MAAFVASPCRLEGTQRHVILQSFSKEVGRRQVRIKVVPPQGWRPPPVPRKAALPRSALVRRPQDANPDLLGRAYRHGELPNFSYPEWQQFTLECEQARNGSKASPADDLSRTHRHGVLPLFGLP